jgi:hypothetical protein
MNRFELLIPSINGTRVRPSRMLSVGLQFSTDSSNSNALSASTESNVPEDIVAV